MEGYLQIWQGFIPYWNKYYFRIHEQLLLFGPSKEEIEGRVHLKIAQVISKLDDPISLTIYTGTHTIEIRAFSIDQKVKWFKKLKEVQKKVIDTSHNKELFKMKVELSKVNRFKILDDLNTEIWKCHAQLQQRIQEVVEKVKNMQVLKSIDRFRISIDQFKYKTSQILQYIDEDIRDMKARDKNQSYSKSKRKYSATFDPDLDIDGSSQQNDTKFYSFYNENGINNDIERSELSGSKNKKPLREKQLKKISKISQQNSSSSLSLHLRKRKSIQEVPNQNRGNHSRSSLSISQNYDRNHLKYVMKLFHENKVYLKYKNIISSFDNRQSLPEKFTPQQKFMVVSTLIGALTSGADLTKMTMPITTNEPLSMLQKGCECLLYCDLLKKADDAHDENIRILHIAAFTVASYSLNEQRTKQPFTPLLGQTFEFIDQIKGYEYLAEQVSHNPPISAYYTRADNYEIFDNSSSKISFTGNGMRVVPEAKTIIRLEKHGDFYVISKCQISLSNILFGKTCMEIAGVVTIKCKDFNTEMVLEFQEETFWKGSSACKVIGSLSNKGKKLYSLEGYWNKELIVENLLTKQKKVLWKKSHQTLIDYYNFNQLALQLNNLTSSGYKNLPPTDSRFRPDQRALQFRDLELAAEQKDRLELKQRGEENNIKPIWFKQSVLQSQKGYLSNEKYWDQKIKAIWKQSADIF